MVSIDRNALICDLAETYGIYDMKSLPARTVAILSVGLRDNSRIKAKLSGQGYTSTELFLAVIADRIGAIITMYGGKAPSIVGALTGVEAPEKEREYEVFNTPEEFEKARGGGK